MHQIENLVNFQSPISLPVVNGNAWSLLAMAHFLSEFLVKITKAVNNAKAVVCAFSPVNSDLLIGIIMLRNYITCTYLIF